MIYYQPNAPWKRVGLKVSGKYDGGNDDWLSMDGNPNEWAVAFHGVGNSFYYPESKMAQGSLKIGMNNVYSGRKC